MNPTLLGLWSIDPVGNLSQLPDSAFPKSEPNKEDIDYNLYTAWVNYKGFRKKRVSLVSIELLNAHPRIQKAEDELFKMVRELISRKVDPDIIERSGGLDAVMGTIEWQEWWSS